ncbi:Arm DNA-binding domain-containing protein [Nitrosomonas ureae]|uniref:Arm DNA-binding domain-containing protein n=1 Tax=Nitrosomonas ureae TaxID=44577 RepID=UPI0021561BF3|nr:Arm DNA-binding domain-containing protein [Nitrosomonas ureae]
MLTDTAIRNAKPRDKFYKVSDSGGLYLLVKSTGKYWRMDYRFVGKRKTLAIGVYPTVSLVAARKKRVNCLQKILTHHWSKPSINGLHALRQKILSRL